MIANDRLNQNLNDAQHFLAAIVEGSQDAIVTLDRRGILTTWNKAAERLYGFTAEEAIGRSLTELGLPRNLEEVRQGIERVLQSKEMEQFDVVPVDKDGPQVHLEVVVSPVKDRTGAVVGVSLTARDVTGTGQVQQSVEQSELHFQALADAVPQLIWTNDSNGRATYFNQRWFAYTGLSFEESRGPGWQKIV